MLDVIIDSHMIRVGDRFALGLHRTLRIPDDGQTYPLPPGLGQFPLYKVLTYRDRVPPQWLEEAGALISMYRARGAVDRISWRRMETQRR